MLSKMLMSSSETSSSPDSLMLVTFAAVAWRLATNSGCVNFLVVLSGDPATHCLISIIVAE